MGEAGRGVFKAGLTSVESLHHLIQKVLSFFNRRVIRLGTRTVFLLVSNFHKVFSIGFDA